MEWVHPVTQLMQYKAVKGCVSFLGIIFFGGHAPIVIGAMGVLLLIDVITGVIRSLREGQFTSTKLRSMTFTKIMTYLIVLISSNLAALALPLLHWLSLAVVLWICITEFTSISENLSEITGNKIPSLQSFHDLLRSNKQEP